MPFRPGTIAAHGCGAAGALSRPEPAAPASAAPPSRLATFAVAIVLACGAPAAFSAPAQDAADAGERLAPVVVTATRDGADPLAVPASVDAVEVDALGTSAPGIHTAEALAGVPGVLARNRQNHAQDEQISIRGFGARSTFGVRGVRLYVDGIPATMPDGAGQVSHFNFDSADRIEVLRGPFSALYGNSSGGVIQLFTADGTPEPVLGLNAGAGAWDSHRLGVSARGSAGAFGYSVGLTHFDTDGFRDHSAARRRSGQAKLTFDTRTDGRLTVLANALDVEADDPLGLTREQFDADPSQAVAVAHQYDTRKTVRQDQAGAVFEQPLAEGHSLRALAYGGEREVEQFLAIPPAPQANPRHAGGNIDLDGRYAGADLRWRWQTQLAGRPFDLALGIASESFDLHRRGYENFVGGSLGVRGALRRDEDNRSDSFDQYAQAQWHVGDAWSMTLGARRSAIDFDARDRYVTPGNPDDGGRARFDATLPVAGLLYRLHEGASAYLAWGRGFETPTFAELGYRNDGGSGLNLGLRPARTHNGEIGFKWRGRVLDGQFALFRADTDDEIAVATNSGGRSTYRNVARARRQGAELSLSMVREDWRIDAAYTWLDARFTAPFLACSGNCTVPATPVGAGAAIPGVPRHHLFAELRRGGDTGWQAGVRGQFVSSVTVNDIGSERAPSYALLSADIAHVWALPGGQVRAFVRLDNLADRDHVGSVIVNDGNGRFFEPGPGRAAFAGLQWTWRP
jgi:iron complex outermembrane receptor protein